MRSARPLASGSRNAYTVRSRKLQLVVGNIMRSSDYTVKVHETSHNVTTNIVSVQHGLTGLGGCLLVTWIVTVSLTILAKRGVLVLRQLPCCPYRRRRAYRRSSTSYAMTSLSCPVLCFSQLVLLCLTGVVINIMHIHEAFHLDSFKASWRQYFFARPTRHDSARSWHWLLRLLELRLTNFPTYLLTSPYFKKLSCFTLHVDCLSLMITTSI